MPAAAGNSDGGKSAGRADGSAAGTVHNGRLLSFSAYSLLIYLNDSDGYAGGATSFFRPILTTSDSHAAGAEQQQVGSGTAKEVSGRMLSRRGLTWAPGQGATALYEVAVRVKGMAGDCLVFPHGNHPGSYPNPLHEGSAVRAVNGGSAGAGKHHSSPKYLIRTDVIFET
jgi:hypothetical protein